MKLLRFLSPFVFLLPVVTFLMGCQTNQLKQYEKLKMGMDKDSVLELVGTPKRVERFHDKDRWTYVFYENHQWYTKEVQFTEGFVNYLGNVWQPVVSAAEQDQHNEATNRQATADWEKSEKERKDFLNTWNPDPEKEPIKYVPEFKPLQ